VSHHAAALAFFFFAGGTRPQNTRSETLQASAIFRRFSVVGVVPSLISHWETAGALMPILLASAAWVSPAHSRHRVMRSLSSTTSY
jgi:hypothetical protein